MNLTIKLRFWIMPVGFDEQMCTRVCNRYVPEQTVLIRTKEELPLSLSLLSERVVAAG